MEAVTRDTLAAASGLQTDDLVVAVGNRTVTSQRGLRQELSRLIPGDPIQLSIIRDGSIVFVDLGVIPAIAEPKRKR